MNLLSPLPLRTPRAALSVTATATTALRLVVWDDGVLTSVREQELTLPAATHAPQRQDAWRRAWTAAFPRLVASMDIDVAMPTDLFLPELLDDPALQTEADFTAAFSDAARVEGILDARERRELRAALAAHLGAGHPHVDATMALAARPSIEIASEPAGDDLPLGESRLGGLADLPAGQGVPHLGGQPLPLIAQIDLASVDEPLLPPAGWLLFFFDLCGWDAKDPQGGGRVVFVGGPRAALLRQAPSPEAPPLPLRRARLVPRPLPLPHFETPFYAGIDAAFLAGRIEPGLDADVDRPRDRLLGYADPLQGDAYARCEHQEPAGPEGWSLLLQADSDRDAHVFLGDMGVLQFFIRPTDLAARRFDRVQVVWQSC